jgi:TonB-linked SusC/RagA family outer membrane protein
MKKTVLLLLASFFCTCFSVHAQEIKISGTVKASDDGLPLPGVVVTPKSAKQKALITDAQGKYSISIPTGETLIFSFTGFKSQEKVVNTAGNINVIMVADIQMLDEVVAIGYGVMKKSDITGAVTSIKAEQLQRTPAAGIDQALQGRAAGVTVNANSGQPGAPAQIRIRGIGTVNNSAPIFVVDGIIVDDVSFLSPNDVESTEVLKDASATAIYGSRGANGVILITTKKGSVGKSNISFNAYTGIQNRWRKLDLMGSREFAETTIALNNLTSERNFYRNNGFNAWIGGYKVGNSPYYPVIQSNSNPNGLDYSTIETDWQDEVFHKNAGIQNYHLSIDGGTEKSIYAISGSYFRQEGTIIGSNFSRLSLRLNTAHKVKEWLKVGQNLSFSPSEGRNAMNNHASPNASILSAALAMAPWDPTHYPAGSVNRDGKDLSGRISSASNFQNVTNPFSMVEHIHPSNKSQRLLGNIYAEITPFEGLVFRSDVSLDLVNSTNMLFKDAYKYSEYDLMNKNFIDRSMAKGSTLRFENIATYSKDINKHSFSVMGGQITEEYNYYTIGGSGFSILNPSETNWYLSRATEDRTFATDGVARTRMFSLLGRVHYSYDSKYLATFNMRTDGSSKFQENPWGYFPSTALAWRISEEDWMKDFSSVVDNLKIRLGWGQIGNEKIGNDNFIQKIETGGPTFVSPVFGLNQQWVNGAAILSLTNKGGKWERSEQWNAGIDFGLYNSKFSGTVDLFLRDTKDMLLPVKAPAHVGNRYDAIANVGTVRNQGVELSLTYQNRVNVKASPLNYNISGNVSFIKNELTALNGGERIWGTYSISDMGLPLFTLWGYQYEGIYRTDQQALEYLDGYTSSSIPYHQGDAIYKDLNDDGIIDDKDKTNIGNPFPWLTYGLNFGADWKKLDLQFFLQGVHGNEVFNAVRMRTEGSGAGSTLSTTMRDVWSSSNKDGSIPNPISSVNGFESSRFVESGSYLRLKNVQLGYTFSNPVKGINKCRVYIAGNNLLTFTNYTGYDPEVGSGIDFGNYPQSRTLMFGLNVNL